VAQWLVRWARRERIANHSLREAVERSERGVTDADLGGNIIKQRGARSGQRRLSHAGRLPDRTSSRACYGFARRERENIDADELPAIQGRSLAGGYQWRERNNLAGSRERCSRRPTTCGTPACSMPRLMRRSRCAIWARPSLSQGAERLDAG
jgi:hypothetical protein